MHRARSDLSMIDGALGGGQRLREHLAAVARAVADGLPITAYFHWTLADNYEWGSYEPRFGLYGVERDGDRITWSSRDAMGHDAAGAYRDLIAGLRGP